MSLSPGTRLGHYQVTALLGEGGMGQVWRATDTQLGRQVALKIVPDAFADDQDRLARFQREAQVLASLNHPGIAQIHGIEEAEGTRALVLELVDGPTLADRIAQGPIPVDEALPIAKQIAEALEAAHEAGVIHRDLKPANIKVREDGTVKVLDFGLSKALDPVPQGDPSRSPTLTVSATRMGVILGTAAYMSPEQARGKPVDKRADIWAFGAVLFEMLTGTPPFLGDDVSQTLARVIETEPNWTALPGNLSPTLHTYVRRCLRKEPQQRFRDIGDVRLAMAGAFETARDGPGPSEGRKPVHMLRPTLWGLVGGVALCTVVGLGIWSVMDSSAGLVMRFSYALPPDQVFSNAGRPTIALSTDGRHFVYNTQAGLFLREMDQLEARPISGVGRNVTTPFLSPDGRTVGYFDRESSELKRVGIEGGTPLTISAATNPFGVHWSESGTILFGQPSGIMRVSSNGGDPELVIPTVNGEQVYGPQLLPDGDRVLFSVTRSRGGTRWDEAQVVAQSLRSGDRTVLVRRGSDARVLPTGHLVYAQDTRLFALRLDPGRLMTAGEAVQVAPSVFRAFTPSVNTASANYEVSDDGTLVYASLTEAANQMVWVDRRGREVPLPVEGRWSSDPVVSPDGSRVAVSISGSIYIHDVDLGTLVRLTFDEGEDRSPLWTPDGLRVVFRSDRAGGGLFEIAADGTGEVRQLLEGVRAVPFSWSADGRLIFGEAEDDGLMRDIGVLSVSGDGATARLLTDLPREGRPDVSPNGRWLAYESRESGRSEILVRPFPDVESGRWQVSMRGGIDPQWSPDGKELFFLSEGYVMVSHIGETPTFSSTRPENVFDADDYDFSNSFAHRYDVSPDGQRFLLVKAGTAVLGIYVVLNWLDELKRLVPID